MNLPICRKSLTKPAKVTTGKSFATCKACRRRKSGIEWKILTFHSILIVGLVEVAPTKLGPEGPHLMTSEKVIQEFLSRYPESSPDARDSGYN
jgi:hypothetical protein